MKKIHLFFIFAFVSGFVVFCQDLPRYYFNLGTSRNDILFKLGEPKILLTGGHLLYEVYSNNCIEDIVFMFDESDKLAGVTVDINPDYQHSMLPMKDFINRVFKVYLEEYTTIFGKPYIENSQGKIWRFDNGFCVFYPSSENGIIKFHFTLLSRDAAASAGYDKLYAQ